MSTLKHRSPPSQRQGDVSPARRAQLNAGAPTTALTEILTIDFAALMQCAVPQAGSAAFAVLRAQAADGITKRMALAGSLLSERLGLTGAGQLYSHESDIVRGWACYLIAALPGLTLKERLQHIQPLADDAHFGVREWAWLALRPALVAALHDAIELLIPWTVESSERLRRFASEALRPRGVWCSHIAALKTDPALGLPLLTPLRADPSVYVQDSVANWLNDASKDQPDWVRALCRNWLHSDPPPAATQRICKRALRTVGA